MSSATGLAGTGSPSFAITLPKAVMLKKGTCWVSVQADMDIFAGGEWTWDVNGTQHGNPAAWQNPGGYFGFCATWGASESCLKYGPDFMFDLKGSG